MTTSVSFDRAADFYDQTRLLPKGMLEKGVPLILEHAGPGGLILDVGAGTGRISVPLLERGANLIGCDLSREMMAHLRAKHPATRLAQADAVHLPFPSGQFDVVMTVHVMHLVANWQTALREFKRVLKPGGTYVYPGAIESAPSLSSGVRERWRQRVKELGAEWRRPGVARAELLAEIEQIAASVETVEIEHVIQSRLTPRELMDGLGRRIFSDTWHVPDDILKQSIREVREWAEAALGDLDRPTPEDTHLVIDLIRFNA